MAQDADAFVATLPEEERALVLAARELVRELLPGAVESCDGGQLGFGTAPGYKGLVFVLDPRPGRINLGVVDGVTLPDPDKLLTGTGTRHRHVKVRSEDELHAPALRSLLEAAATRARPSG